MADTIARLIFEANTAQLKKANDELKKLAKESGKSARSVDDGTKAQKKNATETQNNTNKTKQNTAAKKKLKKETKDVTTATDKMVVQLKKASNAAAVMTGPLGGVSGRLSFLATGLDRFALKGLAVGVSIAAITTAVKSSLTAFAAYETQMFKLEAITKATGHSAGFTAKQLDQMAKQVGRDTLSSAAGIRDVQGILLSFGQVQGDVFERAVNASVDLSAVMGVTAASSAKTLAKALEDPIGNLTAMTRAGVVFTEEEKKKIQKLAETNKLLEAQDLILSKLEGKIGGAGTGGGLAAATDLLGENITNASIQFARASGVAEVAIEQANKMAKFFGFIGDVFEAAAGTDEIKLQKAETKFARLQEEYFKVAETNRNKADGMFLHLLHIESEKINTLTNRIMAAGGAAAQALAARKGIGQAEEDEFDVPESSSTVGTKDDPMMKIFGPALAKFDKNQELKEKAAAADEKRAADKAEKERVRREEAKAANQLAAEEEMAQAAIFQLQRQDRLTEAALFEKELKDQLAQQDIDRMVAAGEIEASTAQALLEAKLERIRSEYDQELEVIEEKEQEKSDARVAREETELKEKSRLGDLEAQAKIKRDKFEKLTEMQKAKFMTGMYTKALGTFAGQSKKMFKLQKAAGIANATINMFEGVNAGVKLGWPMAIPAVAYALGTGMNSIKQIQAQQFGGASSGGSGGDGGGGGATPAIGSPPVQPADQISEVIAPQPINVTVDGSIDPEGARRIIEAINEATEDGLEINALVGS